MSTPGGPLQIDAAERPADWWHNAVREQERRGEPLAAFDLAERALAEHSTDTWVGDRAVLALARAGATEEAERRFFEYGLQDVAEEDVAALLARIAKDRALAAEGRQRRLLAAGSRSALRRDLSADGRLLPRDQRSDAAPTGRRNGTLCIARFTGAADTPAR